MSQKPTHHTAVTVAGILNGERPRTVGVMVYDDKTGGQLVQMTPDQLRQYKAATNRIGQQSILRHQAPNGGRQQIHDND